MIFSGLELRCIKKVGIIEKGDVVYCFAEEEEIFWVSSPKIEAFYGTPQMQMIVELKENFKPRDLWRQ